MNNFLLGQPGALKLVWAVNVQNYTILPGTLNPPYQLLVEGAGGGWHVRLTLLRPPPVRCPAHPLTEGSVWVSSPVPALISSTYSQYWEYSD
jgi:hypothetical protein